MQRRFLCGFLILFLAFFLIHGLSSLKSLASPLPDQCVDYQVVFARGSGEEVRTGPSNLAFREAISEIFSKIPSKTFRYYDLGESSSFGKPYPAISVEEPEIITGTIISGGKAYDFGQSIKTGTRELKTLYREITKACPATKFIFAGYSQGAMLINQAIRSFNSKKIIYSASFGDPKLYLPEGIGLFPKACNNQQLSSYRQYVPDCYVEQGILGGLDPYTYSSFKDKVGAWCNVADFICGSTLDLFGFLDTNHRKSDNFLSHIFNGHTSYIKQNAYREAAEVIYAKIVQEEQKIPSKNQLIHYYDPNSVLDPSIYLKNPNNPSTSEKDNRFSRNEIAIAFPTFLTSHSDTGRFRLFLNRIFDAASVSDTLIHVYSYGYYKKTENTSSKQKSSNQPKDPVTPSQLEIQGFSNQNISNTLPKDYYFAVKYVAGIEARDMRATQWDSLATILYENRPNIPNVDVYSIVKTTYYDIVRMTPWSKNANHSFLAITPALTPSQNYQTLPNQSFNDRIDRQNTSLHITSFFFNENPLLLNELLKFKTLDSRNIFTEQVPVDQVVHQIFYSPLKEHLEQIVKPSFDWINLTFLQDTFQISPFSPNPSPKLQSQNQNQYHTSPPLFLVPQKNLSTSSHSPNSLQQPSPPLFQWVIKTSHNSKLYTTTKNQLRLPLSDLSTTSIQLTTPDKKVHHVTITPLPKRIVQVAPSTRKPAIFPYRLVILDGYPLGFTKLTHLKYRNLDKSSPHQLSFITFSNLGRITKRQIVNLPHNSSSITIDTSLDSSITQQKEHLAQPNRPYQHPPKAPNCGVGPPPR